MEKKKAERERIKAEKEKLKQEAKAQQEKDVTSKQIPEPEEDIVDALLKEIRAGTTLRTSGEPSRRPSRCVLKKEDMAKLEQMKQEKQESISTMTTDGLKQEAGAEPEQTKRDNKTMMLEFLKKGMNGKDVEELEEAKQGRQENMTTITEEPGKHTAEDLQQMKEEKEAMGMTVKDLEEEVNEKRKNGETFEQTRQEKQENITNTLNTDVEQKANNEDIERPAEKMMIQKRKQENKTMVVEDLEKKVNGVE